MNAVQLTKTQRYWKKHVMAGLQSGSTMQSYADQQDFNVKTLYDWKYRLTKMGALDNAELAPAVFQKVHITPTKCSVCIISLPNGITVEWPADAAPVVLGDILSEIRKLS